jgi:hypothetical protein
MYDIKTSFKADLAAQPESGMGYQLVEARFEKAQRSEFGIAYNGELLVLASEPIIKIARESFELTVLRAPSASGEIRSLTVVQKARAGATLDLRARESLGLKAAAEKVGSGPASEAPVEETNAGEAFKRFVAYANDFRLRADKSWSDGTYATTEDDAKNVKTGSDAVKRYALPNPAPASYVRTGRPNKGTKIQRGTAQPAFGQPGGGAEVIFPKGTQPNTITGPVQIPD